MLAINLEEIKMSMTLLDDKTLDQVVGGLTLYVGQNSGSPNVTSATVFDLAHMELADITFMKDVSAPPAAIPGAVNAFGKVAGNTDIANITVGL